MLATETRTEFAHRMNTLLATPARPADDHRVIDLRNGARDASRLAMKSAFVLPSLAAATWFAAHLIGGVL